MIIYLLVIQHRHGTDVFTHKTNQGSLKRLHRYVLEWWDEAIAAGAMQTPSKNMEEAIEMYFEYVEDEFYWFDTSILEE